MIGSEGLEEENPYRYKNFACRLKAAKPIGTRQAMIVLFRHHRKTDHNYKDGKWSGM